jgi:hypothetical protein
MTDSLNDDTATSGSAVRRAVDRLDVLSRAVAPAHAVAHFDALFAGALAACGDERESDNGSDSGAFADAGPDADAGSDAETDAGECAGSGVSKGPWSLAIDETTAKIRWEACRAGVSPTLTLTPEAGGAPTTLDAVVMETVVTGSFVPILRPDAPADVPGTYWLHEAHAQGLAAGTCYRYELAADPMASGRLCTARAAGESFTTAVSDTSGFSADAVQVMDRDQRASFSRSRR